MTITDQTSTDQSSTRAPLDTGANPSTTPRARTAEWSADLLGDARPERIIRFVLGYEPIAEWISLSGGARDRYLLEPVTAAGVVLDDGRWLLVDSGFNVDIVRDRARRSSHFDYDGYIPIVPPGDPLVDQVAAAGLQWGDLAACLLSHGHLDHTGGLQRLPAGTPVLLQRVEWEWITTEAGRDQFVIPADVLEAAVTVVLLDGDTPLLPGVAALDTAGHTPGHQSFRVDLPGETVVLACDAADIRANIERRLPCGFVGKPGYEEHAQRSIDRLADLDETEGVAVWPGHDPEFWAWQDVAAQWRS